MLHQDIIASLKVMVALLVSTVIWRVVIVMVMVDG